MNTGCVRTGFPGIVVAMSVFLLAAIEGQAQNQMLVRPSGGPYYFDTPVLRAVLGFLGSSRGLPSIGTFFTNRDELERPVAVLVQSIMAVLCLVYVVAAVRSFIAARKKSAV